jgi:hypothetical protein
MNTPLQWAARPAVRFAGMAAGIALLLGACGESVPEAEKTGSVTPPATVQLAQVTVTQ